MGQHDDTDAFEITSLSNPRVKWLVDLRRRRTRIAEQVTVLEGRDELELALRAGVQPRELYYCPALVRESLPLARLERLRSGGTPIVALAEAPFRKVSYRESPDGWLAVVGDPARPIADVRLGPCPLVLVCEAVEKPGNLGAMLRTADAVGADAVVAAAPVADWGNPNVVRASKGTVFAVPVASASTADAIAWSRSRRLSIVVATPEAADLVTETDLTGPTALVVGAEHSGVSQAWVDAADVLAKLPMVGHVNSLNVATSAAVCLYEAVRQRDLAKRLAR